MELEVHIAHSGQILRFQAADYASDEDVLAALSQQSGIALGRIRVLTEEGKTVKQEDKPLRLQDLLALAETKIYIYDRRIPRPVEIPVPRHHALTDPPNRINDAKSQESWHELFETRLAWVERAVHQCASMAHQVADRHSEIHVMADSIAAAVASLKVYLKPSEKIHREFQEWAKSKQPEYNILVTKWEAYLSLARSIPINAGVAEFMTDRDMTSKSRTGRPPTLEDLLDLDMVKNTGRRAPQTLRKLNQLVNDEEKIATRMFQTLENAISSIDKLRQRSAPHHEPHQLLEDIEAVARKIDADCRATLEFSNSAKDLAQVSKMAARHTEALLPTIKARAVEMDNMLQYATKARNDLAVEAAVWMERVTDLTAEFQQLKSQLKEAISPTELKLVVAPFDYLRLIQQVPYIYASFAAEALRRRTWRESVFEDATALTENMAQLQIEENNRRKQWLTTIKDSYSNPALINSNNAAVFEIHMADQEQLWPDVTHQDLTDFYETIQRQKAAPHLINDIGKLIEGLNKPTKLQTKWAKAFKNGSIHESAMGRSGLMIRGDTELLRELQEDKQRLESKLRTAESRVKRLESILHHQSAASTTSFQALLQQSGQHFAFANGSTATVQNASQDRRRSPIDLPEDALRRIHQLEGDLNAEKEKYAAATEEVFSQRTQREAVVAKMEEANSTKTDLLKNMNDQQRDFLQERKSLEDTIKQLKDELEEAAFQMDNVDESKEHAEATYDTRIQILKDEIAKLTKERSDDVLKSVGQVECLRNEGKMQREQIENLEKKLKAAQDENRTVFKRLDSVNKAAETRLQALRDIHSRLAPQEKTPDDYSNLIESVTNKSSNVLEKVHNIESDMSVTKSELERAQNLLKDLRAEKTQLEESLASEEDTARQLRESLGEETARVGALESELAESRKQLSDLRAKLSDGETGSDSLRKKLEEEEKKITLMAENLASKQSQVGSIEEELRLFKDKLEEAQSKLGTMNGRFVSRTEQTKDLTQKLYTQNDRLCRLLERLGFSITRTDGSITIRRVPRAERSSTQNESSANLEASTRRSSTLSKTPDSSDLELLYWMNHADQATETEQYQAFMSELGAFDMDAFTDTVHQRLRDMEHMARKSRNSAREYRKEVHDLKKASHSKIAFKDFKEGDLALFLPTRNEETGSWAAFNVGHPHYFLREQDAHGLRSKDYILARINRITERVVNLSKPWQGADATPDGAIDEENDNPFALNDGLRYWVIDATEATYGAPLTPGMAKTTVAANKVDAMAETSHARNVSGGKALGLISRPTGIDGVSKTLSKSLESRRSSTSSRRALPYGLGNNKGSALASETNSVRAAANDAEASTAAGHVDGAAAQHSPTDPPMAAAGQEDPSPTKDGPQAHEVRYPSSTLDDLLGP